MREHDPSAESTDLDRAHFDYLRVPRGPKHTPTDETPITDVGDYAFEFGQEKVVIERDPTIVGLIVAIPSVVWMVAVERTRELRQKFHRG